MNILIPHSWLLEHLETKASIQEIQRYLSLCGPSVERVEQIENEAVFDIEVTTNRVDSMSIRGIAREAAVILSQFGLISHLKPLTNQFHDQSSSQLPLPKIFNHPAICSRVICVIIGGVKRQPTPKWMVKRLKQIGQNVHDSAIDITNYITHELGYPCHAFDYDKLMATGGEIHIVEATKGEQFTTLDQESFTTVGGEVVFKDAHGEIIDLPSIKGTANTSMGQQTTNILLLLESIRPGKVRFASMTHAIRTTAAQLMEKGVDPHLAEVVIKQAAQLYQTICQAQTFSQIYDDFPQPTQSQTIKLESKKITQFLGIEVAKEKVVEILTGLECQVDTQAQDYLLVTPPTFRRDLEIPVDLVEEVARIYGYHNLPSTLMSGQLPVNHPSDQNFTLENKIKHLLADLGVQELYTYSMVSVELAIASGYKLEEHLKIQNPLSDDKVYLRRSLIPSLIQAIEENSNLKELEFFEIAHVYHPVSNNLPQQALLLSLVARNSYRLFRGKIETLLDKLFISDYHFTNNNQPANQALIQAKSRLGNSLNLGKINVESSGIITCELEFAKLQAIAQTHPYYRSILKNTSIIEDLTFQLFSGTHVGDVIETIKQTSNLITKVELVSVFDQNFSFTITYQDQSTNLTSETVKPIREQIVKQIQQANLAKLVGKLPQ